MTPDFEDKRCGLAIGPFIADAFAMPVHWYYDRAALRRDHGEIRDYQPPRNPHPDSILWRSTYAPRNKRGDILGAQAKFWGQRGIHYHQFLKAGENTINLQLGRVLQDSLAASGRYDLDDYLRRYVDFMLAPDCHRDTYVEEYHRHFFTLYAAGKKPRQCGGRDIHIGGLAHVGILCAHFACDPDAGLNAVREHVGFSHAAPEVLAAAVALARMIFGVLAGTSLRNAIVQRGTDWISVRKIEQWMNEADNVVIGERLSPACYIKDAFTASLYLSWKYAEDFGAAVIANTNAGGDNCHRGAVIGALVGAAAGLREIPRRLVAGLAVSTANSCIGKTD